MNSFQDFGFWPTVFITLHVWFLAYDCTLSTNINLAKKIKEYKQETHLTWKLRVLITPDAFFGSLLRISVSGTHLADERTWFVAEGAGLAWKAFWCVGHPCVVMGDTAWREGPVPPLCGNWRQSIGGGPNSNKSACPCFCYQKWKRNINSKLNPGLLYTINSTSQMYLLFVESWDEYWTEQWSIVNS